VYISEEQILEYLNLMTEFFIACLINKNNFTTVDISSFNLDETVSTWAHIHENTVQFASKLNWSNYMKFKDKIDPAKNR